MSDLNAKIIPLQTSAADRVPDDATMDGLGVPRLDVGEIAINLADKKIYSKNAAGEIVVLGAGADGEGSGLPGGGFKLNEDGGIEIPLAVGDALRYDGAFWRPVKYKLEGLDNVAGVGQVPYMSWVLSDLVDGKITEGSVYLDPGENDRLKFKYIDAAGENRSDDWVNWLGSLKGSAVIPGDQFELVTTLHFWIEGVRYQITTVEFDDDYRSNEVGLNEGTWQIESNLLDLYPDALDTLGARIEIEEFNSFLGLPIPRADINVQIDREVLQYSKTAGVWVPQALDFLIDEAANIALRVDPGSGSTIPKAVGDALLWNGTYWVPTNPLSGQSINSLLDVNTATTTPSNGQALVWDEANQYWKPGSVASDAPDVSLDDLTDTDLTSVSQGQVLKYQDGAWINAGLVYADISDGAAIPQTIGDLSDVDLSQAAIPGQVLIWDGTSWKPGDQTGGGGGGDSVVGALTERADVAVSETFNIGQSKNLEFAGLGEAGKFVQVTVSAPSWIRFYATSEDRAADATRSVDDDPLPGSGVLMEIRTNAFGEVVKITPGAIYYNNDLLPSQALYCRAQNQSGLQTTITTTVRAYTSTSTDAIDGGTFGSG